MKTINYEEMTGFSGGGPVADAICNDFANVAIAGIGVTKLMTKAASWLVLGLAVGCLIEHELGNWLDGQI